MNESSGRILYLNGVCISSPQHVICKREEEEEHRGVSLYTMEKSPHTGKPIRCRGNQPNSIISLRCGLSFSSIQLIFSSFYGIKITAAVSRNAGEPMQIEEIEVAFPIDWEVRIKILCTSVCHSDITVWKLKVINPHLYDRVSSFYCDLKSNHPCQTILTFR